MCVLVGLTTVDKLEVFYKDIFLNDLYSVLSQRMRSRKRFNNKKCKMLRRVVKHHLNFKWFGTRCVEGIKTISFFEKWRLTVERRWWRAGTLRCFSIQAEASQWVTEGRSQADIFRQGGQIWSRLWTYNKPVQAVMDVWYCCRMLHKAICFGMYFKRIWDIAIHWDQAGIRM